MLHAISFKAKPGKVSELHGMLDDAETGRAFAEKVGAVRNTLFLRDDGRMVRILEFPEGAEPVPMHEVAAADPRAKEILGKIGALVEDGFDVDDPASMQAFDARNRFRLAYDVRR